MSYRISVDTGGTFTDVVVAGGDAGIRIGKALTTRERAFSGIRTALEPVVAELGLSVEQLLADTEVFTYGTTRSTNAIVEGKTARTAFFTTSGFPDVLLLREGGKPDPFRQMHYPPPYVPRYLTWEMPERIDAEGGVVEALHEAAVVEAIAAARASGCEAIAVCLIWSIVNPTHELRIGELIAEHAPGLPYTLSHQLNPIVREYRRASSTAIDASLKPLMQEYLETMARDLRAAGFGGHLFIATSFGGSWRPAEVVDRPIYSVGSGPSLAPVAARTYGRVELGRADADAGLIVCDTGGTTFDVGLVQHGEIGYTAETWLGGRWIGHITGIRSVDVKSIGAGGGSIVWIDPGGLLRVGPRSAGADPGPAAYGRGGTEPTVTDAAVVLGYLDPDFFLGGRLTLDVEAARAAIARVAAVLGMTIEQAASSALIIATENIVGAIKEITIARGIDPREVTVVAGGGASGLNIVPIARELGCRRVLLPATAGALSACGGMYANVIHEFSVSRYAETNRPDLDAINGALDDAQDRADAFLASLGDVGPASTRVDFLVDARYKQQVWELPVPLPTDRLRSADDVRALEEAFHEVHERVFAVREPGQYLECLVWKARATAELATLPLTAPVRVGEPRPTAEAQAYFHGTGTATVSRYDGRGLAAGTRIEGPAIVSEPTTTVVVYPGSRVTVTELGNYLIDIDLEER